jgi:NAD(P)-dependent dehydrogenase (short-subunit alcohol dehydrogenase family)
MAKLDGKIALVSGAGRGIGQAIATKLAEEGARLVINDLDIEPAEQTFVTVVSLDKSFLFSNVSGVLSYFGMESTYGAAAAIAQRIFKNEIARLP